MLGAPSAETSAVVVVAGSAGVAVSAVASALSGALSAVFESPFFCPKRGNSPLLQAPSVSATPAMASAAATRGVFIPCPSRVLGIFQHAHGTASGGAAAHDVFLGPTLY